MKEKRKPRSSRVASDDLLCVGDLVRYGDGETALMMIEYVSKNHGGDGAHRYYGRQFYGGSVGAYHGACRKPSAADRAKWETHNAALSGWPGKDLKETEK